MRNIKELEPEECIKLTPKQYAMRFEPCHCVYMVSLLNSDIVVYVGCTNNFMRRCEAHRRYKYPASLYEITMMVDDLTYFEARDYEYALIDEMLIQLDNVNR